MVKIHRCFAVGVFLLSVRLQSEKINSWRCYDDGKWISVVVTTRRILLRWVVCRWLIDLNNGNWSFQKICRWRADSDVIPDKLIGLYNWTTVVVERRCYLYWLSMADTGWLTYYRNYCWLRVVQITWCGILVLSIVCLVFKRDTIWKE